MATESCGEDTATCSQCNACTQSGLTWQGQVSVLYAGACLAWGLRAGYLGSAVHDRCKAELKSSSGAGSCDPSLNLHLVRRVGGAAQHGHGTRHARLCTPWYWPRSHTHEYAIRPHLVWGVARAAQQGREVQGHQVCAPPGIVAPAQDEPPVLQCCCRVPCTHTCGCQLAIMLR